MTMTINRMIDAGTAIERSGRGRTSALVVGDEPRVVVSIERAPARAGRKLLPGYLFARLVTLPTGSF